MKQAAFEQLHAPTWRALEEQLQRLEKGGDYPLEAQQQFAALFRKVCHFHALSSFLVDHLDNLVTRAHQQFYRRKHPILQPLIQFVVSDFPALVRAEKQAVMWATLLFLSPLLLFFIG